MHLILEMTDGEMADLAGMAEALDARDCQQAVKAALHALGELLGMRKLGFDRVAFYRADFPPLNAPRGIDELTGRKLAACRGEAERRRIRDAIREVLASGLSRPELHILICAYAEGLSDEEIGQVLGTGAAAVAFAKAGAIAEIRAAVARGAARGRSL